MILEVLFSQLFRLPHPPQPTGFYGTPTASGLVQIAVINYATGLGTGFRTFISACSYYAASVSRQADRWDAKRIFAREVIEKCRRLSYYGQLKEFLPKSFASMIPPPPDVVCKFDDEEQPGHEAAVKFVDMIVARADDNAIMAEMREPDGRYDPDMFGIFFAVLLKTAAKSFSHTFVALSRYSTTLKTVADTSDEMQERIIILVDKMLKMQILDCGVVISWIFSESLRSETDR
ncbi:hypothetical protein NECAME_06306 [Necator americanus]|uniref:MIF4G-like type 2 domain-containing protein n=1 Tax=Necator americanus TaxID=51031 RepID=W2TXD0_NECAM|nr:hypothetical protein NECAME_06306 [Necator americanus]ETN85687.1 hypothetical protein NECAME_06306 [Necator americanus]